MNLNAALPSIPVRDGADAPSSGKAAGKADRHARQADPRDGDDFGNVLAAKAEGNPKVGLKDAEADLALDRDTEPAEIREDTEVEAIPADTPLRILTPEMVWQQRLVQTTSEPLLAQEPAASPLENVAVDTGFHDLDIGMADAVSAGEADVYENARQPGEKPSIKSLATTAVAADHKVPADSPTGAPLPEPVAGTDVRAVKASGEGMAAASRRVSDGQPAASPTSTQSVVPTPQGQVGASAVQTSVAEPAKASVPLAPFRVADVQVISERSFGVAKTLQLKLEPIDLGTVTARLRIVPEGMTIDLVADRRETAELLSKDRDALGKALKLAGFGDENVVAISITERTGTATQNQFGASDPSQGGRYAGQNGAGTQEHRGSGGQSSERGAFGNINNEAGSDVSGSQQGTPLSRGLVV